MAKRDADIEPPEDDLAEPEAPTVGERLRAAREEKKLSLEDVAAQTRIPQRHLASIENAEWDSLPAPTYTIGFAKSYASAVGLDRSEIGNQLREEMGGQRFANTSSDVFEPADPARTMPKSLVVGAIIAVILLIGIMSWLNKRSLEESGTVNQPAVADTAAPAPSPAAPAPAASAAAQGPVVISATAPVWMQVREKDGANLFSGLLQPGQNYTVPSNATAPVLKTGKPEALRINVGSQVAGPVGPPATTVSNVSLLPADLLKSPAAAAPAASPPAKAAPAPRPRTQRAAPPPAPAAAAEPGPSPPPETNTAQ